MEDEILKHLYDIKEAASAIFRFVRDELLRSASEDVEKLIAEAD